MEQPPRIRDAIKDAAKGAWQDATGEWRQKAQIGDHVVIDCNLFGISVWQRNKNGVIERLDPRNVAFSAREPEPYRELSDSEEAAEEMTWD